MNNSFQENRKKKDEEKRGRGGLHTPVIPDQEFKEHCGQEEPV